MTSNPSPDPKLLRARGLLEQRRIALLADIRHDIRETCAGLDTVQPDDAKDALDAGAVMTDSGIRLSLMHMRAETLVAIDDALARIDAGTYGTCASCGGAIAEARLRATPFAIRCTHCESEKEDADRARHHAQNLLRRLTEERRAYLEAVH